jgi:hypothetical protein
MVVKMTPAVISWGIYCAERIEDEKPARST